MRPHDLQLTREPTPGSVEVTVDRVVHLGFEVRVEAHDPDGRLIGAQLTREEAGALAPEVGQRLHVRADDASRASSPA